VLRIALLMFSLLLAGPALAEKKVALLIGNAGYTGTAARLPNPANDVSAMRAMLSEAGFEVHAFNDLTRAGMSKALSEFESAALGADIGLVFYSGHGIEVNGTNYLLPIDVTLASDRDVKYEAIVLDDVMEALSGVSMLKLVLLDACRDNPFAGRMKKVATRGAQTRGLARLDDVGIQSNLLVGYATAPGQTASDGEGANSPYTAALLRHLVQPGLEIESALRAVARDVVDTTKGEQRPYKTGSMIDTVMLGRQAMQTQTPDKALDPCRDAAAHWSEIRDSKDGALFDEHLRLFPACAFSTLARGRMQALKPVAAIVPETECDRLAADPTDPMKLASVKGVTYDELATAPALAACEKAVKDHSQEPRLMSQYSRSLYKNDDLPAAYEWARKAADLGYSDAATTIGIMYETGKGAPQNGAEAAIWYRKAADAGNPTAMAYLGALYDAGNGVGQDFTQAMDWYRRGAEAGNGDAMNGMGYLYQNALGVPQDYAEAMGWYQKAAALDNASAMNRIGELLYYGYGVPQDYRQAMEWYRKAADKGDVEATYSIGTLYGAALGVEQDYAQAMTWYAKAADKGYAPAIYQIGELHYYGRSVPQDYKQAMEWYRKAGDAGNGDALYSAGTLYGAGLGVEQDYTEARKLYERAAALNQPDAMNALGNLYTHGYGVKKDLYEAFRWYEKAAQLDNPTGLNVLGNFYSRGNGVEQDYAKAMASYRRAAELGLADAKSNIAFLYDGGHGVEADRKAAADWMEQALRSGSEWARTEMSDNWKNWSLDFRKALQQRLKDQDVYSGSVDGSFGRGTTAAIMAIFNKPKS
jgi:TPR repeat protein